MVVVPAAPAAASLDPLLTTWDARRLLVRSYPAERGSREFYPGDPGDPRSFARFSPFLPGRRRTPLPVLYGAADLDGAISETVFHNVPPAGVKIVPRAGLRDRLAVELEPLRDLKLVDLTSDGFKRLGVTRAELIETGPRHYRDTAGWGRALHDCPAAPDGLMWVSRQRDTSLAVVLFGDRVKLSELQVPSGSIPTLLATGPGYDRVAEIADRAGITIVEPV